MSKTEIYPRLVSRARKSLRTPVSALRACKSLYQTVQIFLLRYLFLISHGGGGCEPFSASKGYSLHGLPANWQNIGYSDITPALVPGSGSIAVAVCHLSLERSPQFAECTTAETENKCHPACGNSPRVFVFFVLISCNRACLQWCFVAFFHALVREEQTLSRPRAVIVAIWRAAPRIHNAKKKRHWASLYQGGFILACAFSFGSSWPTRLGKYCVRWRHGGNKVLICQNYMRIRH